MFFQKHNKEIIEDRSKSIFAQSSHFGRAMSSIDAEIALNFKEATNFNPLDYLKNEKSFLGLDHKTQKPLYIKNDDIVHSLITAPTRAGKGIYFGIKAVECLKAAKGLIVIDPKEDDFLPAIIKEELEKQDRVEDFIVWNWQNEFSFKTFESDDEVEAAKKITTMLNLIEVEDEAGASFYRKSERIALKKLMYLFYNSEELLNYKAEKNLLNFCKFVNYFASDLSNFIEFSKEKNKPKANIELLEDLAKRYFDSKLFNKCNQFRERDISTLESLSFSLSEFENINFTENSSILEALIDGKCIYIKSDMLDETALKFLKFVIADIINKARKYKKDTNCVVIADEISFYPTSILSAALATIAGFGVKFILAYQDDGQLVNEYLKSAIKSNCQTKLYYKSSDIKTIEYIDKLGGQELVSKFFMNGMEQTVRQEQESFLNINKQRALPKARVGILIHESIPKPFIIDTSPILVSQKFDWQVENNKTKMVEIHELEKKFSAMEFKVKKGDLSANVEDIENEKIEKFEI
ncbi:Type IV secretory system Conjugative DNA transfer [Aliarcobacter thereius]|uniref:Type IV secretory system Conjugative DNA transfer n=1 Tax=Aliarcobacter thereius TaxID=544718 RepID=A0A1C0B6A2_9BACT|nr:type IV secretory system conjugative DNA transfer family protein [Aliarcobacter thereius]OCL98838.1 Type IV secretory system Conjugative DNA transfer [Aliarcobacter thereius]